MGPGGFQSRRESVLAESIREPNDMITGTNKFDEVVHGFRKGRIGTELLEMLARGYSVPFNDAIQLRNWAVRREDCLLPLAEIARGILDREEDPTRTQPEN